MCGRADIDAAISDLMKRLAATLLLIISCLILARFLLVRWFPSYPVYQGHRLEFWVEESLSVDRLARQRAAKVLNEIGPEAVPFLLRLAQQKDSVVIEYLRSIKIGRQILHPPLHSRTDIRKTAARQLGRLGASAHAAASALIELACNDSESLRETALDALNQVGPEPREAAALAALLDDDSFLVRRLAIEALVKCGTAAVPRLAEGLTNLSPRVRLSAATALQELGPLARGAVRALIESLRDRDHDVGVAAHFALGRIGPDAHAAVPALVGELKNGSDEIRALAVRTLSELGVAAKPATLELIALQKDTDSYIRWRAAYALGRIGPDAREAIPTLEMMLKDESSEVRNAATFALEQIVPQTSKETK